MAKKIEIHLDAIIILFVVFASSLAFNAFQQMQIREMFQKFVDAEWKAQNMEANLKYVKSKLKNCRP